MLWQRDGFPSTHCLPQASARFVIFLVVTENSSFHFYVHFVHVTLNGFCHSAAC